jgi:hypothetical protein
MAAGLVIRSYRRPRPAVVEKVLFFLVFSALTRAHTYMTTMLHPGGRRRSRRGRGRLLIENASHSRLLIENASHSR